MTKKKNIYGKQPDGSYRCQLGWVFSAEECLYEDRIRKKLERQEADRQRKASVRLIEQILEKQRQRIEAEIKEGKRRKRGLEKSELVNSREALKYTGRGWKFITMAVCKGQLKKHKFPGDKSIYYKKSELDALLKKETV